MSLALFSAWYEHVGVVVVLWFWGVGGAWFFVLELLFPVPMAAVGFHWGCRTIPCGGSALLSPVGCRSLQSESFFGGLVVAVPVVIVGRRRICGSVGMCSVLCSARV